MKDTKRNRKKNLTRRTFIKRSFAAGAGMSAMSMTMTGLSCAVKRDQKRPNIIFIMSDDHATNAISCYGGILSRVAKTPNIDRIAAEGMRLDNCFVTNSICTPSRACILTGQYSQKNGVYTLSDKIDPEHQNVAKLLRQGGYQTAIVGKWHLKTEPSGFDYYNVLPSQGRYHNPILKEKGKPWEDYKGGGEEYKGYSTDVITDSSIRWLINREPNKPFFLMCHFKAPHRNWEPAERFADLYRDMEMPEPDNLLDDYKNRSLAVVNAKLKIGEQMTKNDLKQEIPSGLERNERIKWCYQLIIKDYLRCIAAVDEDIGRLLDFIDEQELADNTIVIYTSDQGFFLGEHGYFDKRLMYEESLRMPFVVRYPVKIKPGSVNDDIILNVDFAATFLDYAGLSVPDDMQGRSFRSNLDGNTPADWRTEMYYRYWMHMAHHGVPAHFGIRTKRYKLIFFYGFGLGMKGTQKFDPVQKISEDFAPTKPEWELFDLEKDPQEMNNVYDNPGYADVRRKLKEDLLRLKKELGDTDEKYPELMEAMKEYWE